MKRIMLAVLALSLVLLLMPSSVSAASGIEVVDKTGDGIWDSNTWEVAIYPGEVKSTAIELHNSSGTSLEVWVTITPDSCDGGNLVFELSETSFVMSGGSHFDIVLTVRASGSATPGTYTTQLEIKSSAPPLPTVISSAYTTTRTDFCGDPGFFYIYRGKVLRTVTAGCKGGDLTVTIEKGTIALDESGKRLRTLAIIEDTDPPPLPEGDNFIGLPFKLEPSGATFDPPLIFTWTYDPEDIPEGVTPVIVYWDGDEWITLTGVVDEEKHTVTAEVSHFTTFALTVTVPPLPPEPVKPVIKVEEPEVIEPPPTEPEEPVIEEPLLPPQVVEPEVEEPEEPSYLRIYILIGVFVVVGIVLFGLWRKRRKRY